MRNVYISRRLKENKGQALIEFILVLPMLFLLILNLVNFGGFFYAWLTVSNAARAGANYATQGGASVGLLSAPTAAKVTAFVKADIASLPNTNSVVVNLCSRVNGTPSGTCASIPADPESSTYQLTIVDVTYTYVPFISAFSFPRLGVYLTLPPTTIYQRGEMRSMI
jgi:Flp pilus assembly protein TadG